MITHPFEITEPSPKVSSRYGFISTRDLVQTLQDKHRMHLHSVRHGLNPYAPHQVRMQLSACGYKVGEYIPQLVISNSFDGSKRFSVATGVFRLICSNGMTAGGESTGAEILTHRGNVQESAQQAVDFLFEGMKRISPLIEQMKERRLSEGEAEAFARQALELRGGGADSRSLLHLRRPEDAGSNLWSVFNRVQENAVKGDIRYRGSSHRRLRIRPIKDAARDYDFNRALWSLAEEYLSN